MSGWITDTNFYEPRSTGITLPGVTSVRLNNTVYVYGGGQGDLWTFDASNINNNYSPNQINTKSKLQWMYAVALPFNNQSSFLSVGMANHSDIYLSIQQFDLFNQSWKSIIDNNININNNNDNDNITIDDTNSSILPFARTQHSAFLLNDQTLFIYGGENKTHALNDFWSFDIISKQWTQLVLPTINTIYRCGHSATLMNNGQVVIIGGYLCNDHQLITNGARTLIDMSSVLIYDTSSSQWSEKKTIGLYPQARSYHTAVKSGSNSILICGGQNEVPPPFQIYISSDKRVNDMLAVLSTDTWQWYPIQGSNYFNQPLPQSNANGLMINDNTMMFAFGTTYQTVNDGIFLFDTGAMKWISNIEMENETIKPTMSTRRIIHIVLAVVGGICFLTVLFLIIKMGRKCKELTISWMKTIKDSIWSPRIGEPVWTETTRLTISFFYGCFLIFLIFTLVSQVVNSPIIDQSSFTENPSSTIDVPDIRFCFNDPDTVIRCDTDFGKQCSDYIIPMKMSFHNKRQYCYLFRAPTNFVLGQTSDRFAGNGSYLKFDYYFGQPTEFEVGFYNTLHNPNLPVYNINDPYHKPFNWFNNWEEPEFRASDNNGYLSSNVYYLDVNVVSSASYQLIERVALRDTLWNYVGYSSQVETLHEIETKVQSEKFPSIYSTTPHPIGSLHVYPITYKINTLNEQRAFAIVNATGVFGGLFGLFVSFQACLFGYRPRSPWGVLHRWSVGQMKWSLLNELQKSFIPKSTNVPIVHPLRDETLNVNYNLSYQKRNTNADNINNHINHNNDHHDDFIISSDLEKSNITLSSTSTKATTPSNAPLTTFATTTTVNSNKINTRQPSLPSPLLQNMFVDEPESYDDGDGDDINNSNHNNHNKDNDDCPFVNERLTRMEDRVEMLEKLFQAYYINDEVFLALEKSLQIETALQRRQQQQQQQRRLRQSTLASLRLRMPFRKRTLKEDENQNQ
ncbi:unnamed protein product [Cunninghamella blakesleeana]